MLAAYLLVTQAARGLYVAWDVEFSGASVLSDYALLLCLLTFWLERDSRGRPWARVWDLGFFMALAWPVLLPYYLVRTRGTRKGLLITAAWACAWAVVMLLAGMLATVSEVLAG